MRHAKFCAICQTESEVYGKSCKKCGGTTFRAKPSDSVDYSESPGFEFENNYENYTFKDATLDYQSAVGHFLQAIWFMVCTVIFANWGWSNYSSAIQDANRNCASNEYSCDSPNFGLWILFFTVALGFFIAAGWSGSTARTNLKRADALRP